MIRNVLLYAGSSRLQYPEIYDQKMFKPIISKPQMNTYPLCHRESHEPASCSYRSKCFCVWVSAFGRAKIETVINCAFCYCLLLNYECEIIGKSISSICRVIIQHLEPTQSLLITHLTSRNSCE